MKIQCDVCNKEEAILFCSADEAALCDACDRRVHHANKLAGKHHRFSLHNPSAKDAPRCDVCQEKRAFLFCQEDRAILCKGCDLPIHTANEHTKKHNRFLLTGVKLSSTSSTPVFSSSSTTTTSSSNATTDAVVVDCKIIKKPMNVSPPQLPEQPSIDITTTTPTSASKVENHQGVSTSSISEYLMETLPGWHVEDFLDSSFGPSHGYSKTDDLLSFLDADLESNLSFCSNDLPIWVPEIIQAQPPHYEYPSYYGNGQNNFKESKEGENMKTSKRWSDDVFKVPQISPPSTKRSRHLW